MAILMTGAARAADNEAVAAALKQLFLQVPSDAGSAVPDAQEFLRFYEARAFKPIWTRDDGPKGKARALLAELKISAVHGLSPEFYGVTGLEALMGSKDPSDLASLDALLSGALIAFGDDLRNGRIRSDTPGSENAVAPVHLDVTELIAGAEAADDLRAYMATLLTADFRYFRLIAKLSEFSRLQASGQWPVIDAAGAEIGLGEADARIADIRRLLALAGDLPPARMTGPAILDEGISAGLVSYQRRHGLPQSGVADAATLADMAVPLDRRMRQIRINLERRRWQNRDLGNDYVYINLADDSVKIVQGGESLPEQSLVDMPETRTLPTFFGEITGLESQDGRTALTVRSAHVDRLADKGGERTLVISDPAALAESLIAAQGGGNAMPASGAATFARPLPLFVTYVTAWANGDGSVHFRSDRYGRDAELAALLKLD